MRNTYIITTSEERDLEHSLEHASEGEIFSRNANRATNKRNADFVTNQKRKKASAARAAERTSAARAGDTTNHASEIEEKWKKLIATQQAQIDSLEKKYSQAKKDYDSLARSAYGMQEPNAKKAMQKQLKAKEVQLSGYGSNIRNIKAIIESYKDNMREELAKEAKRYQKAMGTY